MQEVCDLVHLLHPFSTQSVPESLRTASLNSPRESVLYFSCQDVPEILHPLHTHHDAPLAPQECVHSTSDLLWRVLLLWDLLTTGCL